MSSRAGVRIRGSLSAAVRKLGEDVQEKALRSAVRAAAVVLYDEMRARVPVVSGGLRASIYQFHDDKRSVDGRQIYLVGPNKKRAPHWFVVENGHWRVNRVVITNGRAVFTKERLPHPVWVPAQPYIRPTWDAVSGQLVGAMQRRLVERLRELRAGPQGDADASSEGAA